MGFEKWTSVLFVIFVLINSSQVRCDDDSNRTCGLDELNHSILVECNRCQESKEINSESLWPSTTNEIIHVQSTRDGKRLSQVRLENLHYEMDDQARLFDINTTISLKTKSTARSSIIGIGATLDLASLASLDDTHSIERNFGIIIDDLFGLSNPSSIGLSLLRVTINFNSIGEYNITRMLLELDGRVERSRKSTPSLGKLKIMFHIQPKQGHMDRFVRLVESLTETHGYLKTLELWALVLDKQDLDRMYRGNLRGAFSSYEIFLSVPLNEAEDLIHWTPTSGINLQGLLVGSEFSVSYNILDDLLRKAPEHMKIIVLGRPRPKTKFQGDWFNAQEYAIEISNHLRLGVSGFIDYNSVTDLKNDPSVENDSSIYSLFRTDGTYFKGPMFYATGHFSRFLKACKPLEHSLFTQPNMFSSHYSSYIADDKKYVVTIVLNGNEHKQPFNWEVDDVVVTNTLLESKSFNTFIKLIS